MEHFITAQHRKVWCMVSANNTHYLHTGFLTSPSPRVEVCLGYKLLNKTELQLVLLWKRKVMQNKDRGWRLREVGKRELGKGNDELVKEK